jgi:hypothetical protein
MRVVVAAVGTEHMVDVAAAEDEDPVEAVGADGSHPPLGERVRVWCLDWRANYGDALRPEDLVEGATELRVTIVDEEPERLRIAELHNEVARLLGNPTAVRV